MPDFVLTLHFIHLVLVSVYSHGLPENWLWWALQFSSAAFMGTLGVWACRWRELRPITFGGSAAAATTQDAAANGNTATPAGDTTGDEEAGFVRGGRRGRGRDGAGEYEMVAMKGERETS